MRPDIQPGPRFLTTCGYWYWGRPSIYELWLDQREVTRRIRPDRDISSSEMRSARERGERDRFFPYGKRFPTCGQPRNAITQTRTSCPCGLHDAAGLSDYLATHRDTCACLEVGKRTVTVVPAPTSLRSVIVPPCFSAM